MSATTFNSYTCPLSGEHIVSAGAGTGKTYNIQILYLRLVLLGVPVERILVVTFTRLATQELQGRIRSILLLMKRCLEADELPPGSSQVRPFFTRGGVDEAEQVTDERRARCLARVNAALMTFDQAPISTIHGFCQRVLKENAFESGMDFGVDIQADVQALRKQLLTQFWRRLCSGDARLHEELGEEPLSVKEQLSLQQQLVQEKWTPDRLLKELGDAFSNETAEIQWGVAAGTFDLCRSAYVYVQRHIGDLKAQKHIITFDDLILQLNQRLHDNASLVTTLRQRYLCALVDEYQDTDACQNGIFRMLFSPDGEPGRCLFMIGDPQQAIYAFRGGDVQTFLEVQERDGLQRHTLDVNYRASDDYIEEMNAFFSEQPDFFSPEGGNAITFTLIKRPENNQRELLWDADTVDEDARIEQPDVLSRLDGNIEDMASLIERMVLLGKIKLKDRDGAVRPLTYGDIAVLVRTKSVGEEVQGVLKKQGIPAVMIADKSIFSVPELYDMYQLLGVLNDPGNRSLVLRLLGSVWFGLMATEIATVREQTDIMSRLLIFLERIRRQWDKEGLLSAFDMFMHTSLEAIWGARSLGYGQTVTLRLVEGDALEGQQRLAVMRQLIEALYVIDQERQLGVSGLYRLVGEKLRSQERSQHSWANNVVETSTVDGDDSEEDDVFKLRMPTAANSVQIMTIHKSKGLEFPFVMVPKFSGKSSTIRSRIFHDSNFKRCVDFSKMSTEQVRIEELEERRRLMYVAITRAQYLCWFFAENNEDLEEDDITHPEYLLEDACGSLNSLPFSPKPQTEDDVPRRCETVPFKRDDVRPGWFQASFSMLSRHKAEEEAAGDVEQAPVQEVAGGTDDETREESEQGEVGDIMSLLQAHSWATIPLAERTGIFTFFGGVRTGLCWHEVFEHLDFTRSVWEQNEQVIACLEHYGQLGRPGAEGREEREQVFLRMVEDVRTRQLRATDGTRLSLADVPVGQCAHELNFTYHLRRSVAGEEFREVLLRHGVPVPETWSASIRKDWVLNGSIDLLFRHPGDGRYYVVDWKTNLLGGRLEEFRHRECLEQEMQWHFYHLQYVIYTVAFVQYYRWLHPDWELTKKSYASLFGGCFYLFVRGFGESAAPEEQTGVYAACPPWDLIRDLEDILGKKETPWQRRGARA